MDDILMVQYINDIPSAPKAIGPYSQAASSGNLIFISGQIPIDPATGKLVEAEIDGQTEQVMKNLKSILEELGLNFSSVLKATILLGSMDDFQTVNAIYAKWLGSARPARATYAVAGLPLGAKVEIEMIALRE